MKKTKLGILGGGQLGQMSAKAASKLGIYTLIFTPEEASPASLVADKTIIGAYEDEKALAKFASEVDVISYEFENIPVDTIKYLKTFKPVYPDDALLEISQDRLTEKNYLNSIGIPTARYEDIKNPNDILMTLDKWGHNSLILKTRRFGYDGKGQARLSRDSEIDTIWAQFNNAPLIAEEIIDFDCEISVIVARDVSGRSVSYGPMLNNHKNHILDTTKAPANINKTIENKALELTLKLADKINLRGVLTVEFFVTKNGDLLANEIAPRTHNSGHWSIDACAHSQFDNHVRAVCGLPVQDPAQHSPATMINLIGEDIRNTKQYEDNPNAHIHTYGKTEVKQGRKMGHVTILEKP